MARMKTELSKDEQESVPLRPSDLILTFQPRSVDSTVTAPCSIQNNQNEEFLCVHSQQISTWYSKLSVA
jgi:hypothetical protein